MDAATLHEQLYEAYRELRDLKNRKKEAVREFDKAIKEAQETLDQTASAIEEEKTQQLRLVGRN